MESGNCIHQKTQKSKKHTHFKVISVKMNINEEEKSNPHNIHNKDLVKT